MTLIVGGLLYFTGINNSKAYYYGPLAGYTGSPHDGKTCDYSNCHNSHSLQSPQAWISSNIPAAGYSPDTVYTITAKAIKTGAHSFGFEISPQTTGGYPLGKMIVTNSTTQLLSVGSLQYMEQTQYGYQGTDSVVWTFNWKAPAAGNGSVTFYGAFNCGNGNSVATGTYVYPSTLIIPENIDAGISALENAKTSFSLFPNPATGTQINITYTLPYSTNVDINIYELDGRKIATLLNNTISGGQHTQALLLPSGITPGIYLVELTANNKSTIERMVIEK